MDPTSEEFWKDERKIEDMSFGAELRPRLVDVMKDHPWPESEFKYVPPLDAPEGFMPTEADVTGALVAWKKRMSEIPTPAAQSAWGELHKTQVEGVRTLLRRCDVAIAEDIKTLGCTGAFLKALSIDEIKFLRMGLAGGGVGLPCFVPPTRYCYAHETTGGLQEGQAIRYPEIVEHISLSRPLTPAEAAHGKLITEAQWSDNERGAVEKLRGRKLPDGWMAEADAPGSKGDDFLAAVEAYRAEPGPEIEPVRMGTPQWVCTEHRTTNWACRYCVAQAVVGGDLEPTFVLYVDHPTGTSGMTDECLGSSVQKEIAEEDESNSNSVKLYVRVATFSRKLSRD